MVKAKQRSPVEPTTFDHTLLHLPWKDVMDICLKFIITDEDYPLHD
ncbi:hypothetical protein [Waterburya agarophytonicola]|nr:hypothetical protein [Waterburya agarophytonicola]